MTFQSWPRLNRPLRVENSAVQNSASVEQHRFTTLHCCTFLRLPRYCLDCHPRLRGRNPLRRGWRGRGSINVLLFGLAHGSIIRPLGLFVLAIVQEIWSSPRSFGSFVLTYVQVSRSIFWSFSPFDLIIVQAPSSNTSPFTRKYLAAGNSPSREHCPE